MPSQHHKGKDRQVQSHIFSKCQLTAIKRLICQPKLAKREQTSC